MGEQIMSEKVVVLLPAEVEKSAEIIEIQAVAPGYLEKANAITIIDADSYANVGTVVVEIDARIKTIKDRCKKTKSSLHSAHKDFCAFEAQLLGMYEPPRKILANKASVWLTEENRKRKAEEERLRLIADEKARKEREKIEALALAALDKGKEEKAETLLEKAGDVVAEPVFVEPTVEKTFKMAGGGSVTGKSDIGVVLPNTPEEIKEACRAIADGLLPVGCVLFSLSTIKSWAKSNQILGKKHGITISEKTTASFRQ
jgi:hypothetical protein